MELFVGKRRNDALSRRLTAAGGALRLGLFHLALLFLLAIPARAAAPGDAAALLQEIARAPKGAVLTVPAGAYDLTDLRIRRDLALVGDDEGEVVFFSSQPVAKGILNPVDGASVRLENITFRSAASPDLNGAGVRHDGRDLVIVNCRFIGNENGVLATGEENGVIEIAGAAFIDSGHGDGYSHGVYVVRARALTIRGSRFVGTKIGHHVKSLADATTIEGNAFDDAGGRASYAVDVSRGGDVTIAGNSFVKAADADNNALFNYDLSRGGEAVALRIVGNRIVNRNRNGLMLRNGAGLVPEVENNEIVNEAGGRMTGGGPGLSDRLRRALGGPAGANPD